MVMFFEMQTKWPTVQRIWGSTQAKAEAADQQGWGMGTEDSPPPTGMSMYQCIKSIQEALAEETGKIPQASSKKASTGVIQLQTRQDSLVDK